MARLLACVLMVLLPLQSLWGVASRYCAHEVPAVQASHLGHHAHQPHAPQGIAGEGQSGAFASVGLGTEAGSGMGAAKAENALKAAGVALFIFAGGDVLGTLKSVHAMLGFTPGANA